MVLVQFFWISVLLTKSLSMLSYFEKRRKKKERKRTFSEYGHDMVNFDLEEVGNVDYAQWLHPSVGNYDLTSSMISFYKELTNEGDTIIDIGAWAGDTTVPMGLVVGSQGTVIALEPNPYVFKVLAKNAELNPDKTNIVALPFAATEKDGEFVFNYSDASFCNGGFLSQIKNQRHRHKFELKVQGRNLEKYLTKNHSEALKRLSLLKIDAEGYDKEILKGLSSFISVHKPNIMVECYKRLTMEERHELYDSIAVHGYHLYMIDGFEENANRVLLNRDNMKIKKHFEILATPK